MISPARFIRHVTITTGHSRDSFEGEVSPEILAVCRDLLEAVRERGSVEMPAVVEPRCSLAGQVTARSAKLQVIAESSGLPIIDIAIATHSRTGAALWRRIHDEQSDLPTETDRDTPPPEPWCAVTLLPAIELHAEAAEWLGDFERCLAWALVLMREGEL